MTPKRGSIRKIVFIAGIDLCGSTVLDLALGSYPGVLSLGEIDNLLDPEKRIRAEDSAGPAKLQWCTCGRVGAECQLWRDIVLKDDSEQATYVENLHELIGRIEEHLPHIDTLIDSSKEPSALLRLVTSIQTQEMPSPEILVIVLRRNPWSWLTSDSKRARRRNRIRTFRIRARRLRKWDSRYRRWRKLEKELGHKFVFTNLHTLQRTPESFLRRVTKALQVSSMAKPIVAAEATTGHILWGSHHRHDANRKTKIDRGEKLSPADKIQFLIAVLSAPRVLWTNFQLMISEMKSQFL